MLGSFACTDEMSVREEGMPNPIVQKLYTRTSVFTEAEKSRGLDLFYFRHVGHSQIHQSLDSEIVSDQGSEHILQGVNEKGNVANSISGNAEQMLSKISVIINEKSFSSSKGEAVFISAENSIDDTHTGSEELNHYTSEVETTLHRPGLFPKFPDSVPDVKHPGKFRKTKYGRTSFYFGFSTKDTGLSQFLNIPITTLEKTAGERGIQFNEKNFLALRKAWTEHNAQNLNNTLNVLFSDRKHISQVADWFFTNMDQTCVSPFLVAQNPTFGSFQNRGRDISLMEKSLSTSDSKHVDYDHAAIQVEDLSIVSDPGKPLKIHFRLTSAPTFLYFRLTPSQGKDPKHTAEFIVFNRDQKFKVGENLIELDPANADSLSHRLAERLVSNQNFALTIGVKDTNLQNQWGAGKTVQVMTSSFYPN